MQKCSGLDAVARGARKARRLMVLLAGDLPVEGSVDTPAKRTRPRSSAAAQRPSWRAQRRVLGQRRLAVGVAAPVAGRRPEQGNAR
jgi:hypothetical protein